MADSIKIDSTAGTDRPLWTVRIHSDGTFSGRFDSEVLSHPWAFDADTQERHRREISRLGSVISGTFHQIVQAATARHHSRHRE